MACWTGPTINPFVVQHGFPPADPLPGILLGQPGEKKQDAKPASIARVVTSTYKLTGKDQGWGHLCWREPMPAASSQDAISAATCVGVFLVAMESPRHGKLTLRSAPFLPIWPACTLSHKTSELEER